MPNAELPREIKNVSCAHSTGVHDTVLRCEGTLFIFVFLSDSMLTISIPSFIQIGANMTRSLEELESQRTRLLRQLAESGDMRRGSINEVYRRCGKDNCACAGAEHPGHGPFYAYTTKVNGKTKTLQLRPGALLSKIEREVAEYKKFRTTSDQVIGVNEQICNARSVPGADTQEKKRRSSRTYRAKSPRKSKR